MALADPVVGSVSNSGILGGRYSDNNHFGVVPTLLVGLTLVLAMLAQRFASIIAMQLAALFALESLEQLAAGGRLLGGTAWLGGPVAFSLSVHAFTPRLRSSGIRTSIGPPQRSGSTGATRRPGG